MPYKRIDIAVEAFNNSGKKLLVVGDGPELAYLKSIAAGNISFVGNATDKEVVDYLKKCRALIFPGEEDFGIVPLEAQACGKAVIAFGKGGALETIIALNQNQSEEANPTGMFFYEQTAEDLGKAVLKFEQKRDLFNAASCRNNALRFDRPIYQKAMEKYINQTVKQEP